MYPFLEYIDGDVDSGVVPFTRVSVSSGQSLIASVTYLPSSGETTFYVYNTTTGTSWAAYRTLAAGYWDGHTAEFVDERPTYDGSYTNLNAFDPINWSDAQVEDTSGTLYDVGEVAHDAMDMYNNSVTYVMAGLVHQTPAMTSSTSWVDYFDNCQG
jgi:hypothetical protein